MNIVQLTPGAGGMYCGCCLRDNALVHELRRQGHAVLLVPLYLPLKTDEPDRSAGTPVFFGGINVYLQQKAALFRKLPPVLDRLLDAPSLLNFAAGFATQPDPHALGALVVSMLKGEEGKQAKELDRLLVWLKTSVRPDVVVLSNALLSGLARKVRAELDTAVVITLHGEDTFLDSLPEPHRTLAWDEMARRAGEAEAFVVVSHYYADLMAQRMNAPRQRMHVVYNGIASEKFAPNDTTPRAPVIGYFARMCATKGLGTLVDAFCLLKQGGRMQDLKLRVGGTVTPADEEFLSALRAKLQAQSLLAHVEFRPNLDLAGKQAFFEGLSVFSVPATYGESFGLYVLEALACGVPVVQPRHAAFPEVLAATGGGVLCEPNDVRALAEALERLLLEPDKAHALGQVGRATVAREFTVERMARNALHVYEAAITLRRAKQQTVREAV